MISCLIGAPGFIHIKVAHFNRISQKCEIDNNLTIKKTLAQQSTRGLDLKDSLSRLRMVNKLVR